MREGCFAPPFSLFSQSAEEALFPLFPTVQGQAVPNEEIVPLRSQRIPSLFETRSGKVPPPVRGRFPPSPIRFPSPPPSFRLDFARFCTLVLLFLFEGLERPSLPTASLEGNDSQFFFSGPSRRFFFPFLGFRVALPFFPCSCR